MIAFVNHNGYFMCFQKLSKPEAHRCSSICFATLILIATYLQKRQDTEMSLKEEWRPIKSGQFFPLLAVIPQGVTAEGSFYLVSSKNL